MLKDLIAHYTKGNSDKIYIVSVRDDSVHGGEPSFSVIGKWGKVGRVNQSTLKCVTKSDTFARLEQQRIFQDKLKKGYMDIDHEYYSGGVTRQSLASLLEEKSLTKPRKKKVKKIEEDPVGIDFDFEVEDGTVDELDMWSDEQVCVDNHAMEDGFDEGVTYVVERSSFEQPGYIYAYDKFGLKRTCSRKRFSCTGKVKGIKS
jgi:predicted DNA-binding WGR domain protein